MLFYMTLNIKTVLRLIDPILCLWKVVMYDYEYGMLNIKVFIYLFTSVCICGYIDVFRFV